MSLALAVKAPCLTRVYETSRDPAYCYSDLAVVYTVRSVGDDPFPPRTLEYPALTVLFAGAAAVVTSSAAGFATVNAIGLAVMGLLTFHAVQAMATRRRRLLVLALGPPLFLYGFLSWDLLAVGLAMAGLLAFSRGADGWAGFALGLGASAKLYPGLLVPAFILARWADRAPHSAVGAASSAKPHQRSGPRAVAPMVAGFAVGLAVPNVILFVASPEAWAFFWTFQSERAPGIDTWWAGVWDLVRESFHPGPSWDRIFPVIANVGSVLLLLLASGVLLLREWRRHRIRPYAQGFALIVLFLLVSKVYSLQYSLWLLPLFVLLGFPWYALAAYFIADASVWASFSAYAEVALTTGDLALRLTLLNTAVVARYMILVWLLWLSFHVPELVGERMGGIERSSRDTAASPT